MRLVWIVAYVLMLVSMLNNLPRLNTDAIAYMRVAEYWSTGNLDFAVNGYWGPLLSWLMVPFLWLGVETLFAAKLAMLISGGVFFSRQSFFGSCSWARVSRRVDSSCSAGVDNS